MTINWTPGLTIDRAEQIIIEQAFRWYKNNKTQTSAALGISVRTLDNKLERYEQDEREQQRIRAEDERQRKIQFDRQRAHSAIQSSSVPSPGPGMRLEPATEIRSEPSLPVSERTEVQEVLPKSTSKGRSAGTR